MQMIRCTKVSYGLIPQTAFTLRGFSRICYKAVSLYFPLTVRSALIFVAICYTLAIWCAFRLGENVPFARFHCKTQYFLHLNCPNGPGAPALQMIPKWSQHDVQRSPKWTQNESQIHPNLFLILLLHLLVLLFSTNLHTWLHFHGIFGSSNKPCAISAFAVR